MDFKDVAILAARRAGEVIKRYYEEGGYFSVKDKAKCDYVTQVDLEAEEVILTMIKKYFPTHAFITEESSSESAAGDYMWIIDPLDGTTNFLRKIPFFSVSIALADHDKIILGCVYNPLSEELFFAEAEQGAFLNGKKISVSSVAVLEKAIVSQSFDYALEKRRDNLHNINAIFFKAEGLRMMHSTALELCNVACGRTDAHLVSGANSWDIAAGALMIEEAGGKVTQFDGSAWVFKKPRIVASNGLIHDEMRTKL